MSIKWLIFILILIGIYAATSNYYDIKLETVTINETHDEFYYFNNNLVDTSAGTYEIGHPFYYVDQKWETVSSLVEAPGVFAMTTYGWEFKELNVHKKIILAVKIN